MNSADSSDFTPNDILADDVLAHLSSAALQKPLRQHGPTPAWDGHIPFAFWCVERWKPGVLLELGTHAGTSYFAFCQSVKENRTGTKCFAVDTWQGDPHAKNYGDEIFESVDRHNHENYKEFSQLLRMTFDEALNQFADGSVDLLHIDGFHTYAAVRHDFDTWLPKMSRRGVVLFHDSNVFRNNFGVWRLMRELEKRFPYFHFAHSCGLSMFIVGPDGPDEARWMASLSGGKREIWRRIFAQLGECTLQQDRLPKQRGMVSRTTRSLRTRVRPWRPL